MKIQSGLHRLVRQLSPCPHQRCIVAGALVGLVRQRRRTLGIAASFAGLMPPTEHPKLRLWQQISAAIARAGGVVAPSQAVLASLQTTQAWRAASLRQRARLSSPFGRGLHYSEVLHTWSRQGPDRLLIFHHYDRRGWMPRRWLLALVAIRQAGWTVVVSSSGLQQPHRLALEAAGIAVADRLNLGLCLGAYKDLVLLLHQSPKLVSGLQSLVLCNDSTLPVGPLEQLLHHLEAWHQAGIATDQPRLSGYTDSIERDCYHLQSYMLHANPALLQSASWLRFWLGFEPTGSKDELINRGELGLSQALLAEGAALWPMYGLIRGLLEGEGLAAELSRHQITDLRQANQTLFAWQSLLQRGCPLVKKRVLLEQAEPQGHPIALPALTAWLPQECRASLMADLQELLISRYSSLAIQPEL